MISIIIPVWNEEGVICKNISTLKAMTSYGEVIFCDGGSTDATVDLLQAASLTVVFSPQGRAYQMNMGAQFSRGDTLVFVHIDTCLSESHLSAMERVMQDDDVVGGHFDVKLSGTSPLFRVIETMMNGRSCWSGISTGDQCQFVRRRHFEAMGGFSNQPLMEDIEFSKRLKRMGKVGCVHQKVITSSRRWEKYGVLRTIVLMWKLRLLYALGVSPQLLSVMYRHAR